MLGGSGVSAPIRVLVFAVLTAVTYYALSGQEFAHSSAGIERHRIDTAAALKFEELAHQQELRRIGPRIDAETGGKYAGHERY